MFFNQKISILILLSFLLYCSCKSHESSTKETPVQTASNSNPAASQTSKKDPFIEALTGTWCSQGWYDDELNNNKKSPAYFIKKENCEDKTDYDIIRMSDVEKEGDHYYPHTALYDITPYYRARYKNKNDEEFDPAKITIMKCTQNDFEFIFLTKRQLHFTGTFSQDKKTINGYYYLF